MHETVGVFSLVNVAAFIVVALAAVFCFTLVFSRDLGPSATETG